MSRRAAAPLQARPAAPVSRPAPAPVRLARAQGATAGLPRFLSAQPHPESLQCAPLLRISSPGDPAEVEAERTARQVIQAPGPSPLGTPPSHGQPAGTLARQSTGGALTSPEVAADIRALAPAGQPLPAAVRRFMEPRFGARFDRVRIHTHDHSARLNRQVAARAFTVGPQIFFGQGQFQPDSQAGLELIAHELTHTLQQGAATPTPTPTLRRSPASEVTARSEPQVQRGVLGLPSFKEFVAEQCQKLPGFSLFSFVVGFNPITGARVERNAGNLLRAAIEIIPGGHFITDALAAHGIFDRISAWASTQFDALKDLGSSVATAVEKFIRNLGSALLNPLGAWENAKNLVAAPVNRVLAFAKGLKDGVVGLIKDAILKPIGAYAKKTPAYGLLAMVMGQDPITGEPVTPDPEALIGGFLNLIKEQETWEKMQQAKAVPRIIAWFKKNLGTLKGFVAEIPALFVTALKSLDVADIILIPRAFLKLAGVFGGFALRFTSWVGTALWDLLEIIIDVVSPGALGYIKRTGAALKSILKNPLPFMGNLVNAAKLGFTRFAGNFFGHLKAGLLDWLTGSLPGIYIPKSFALKEIAQFALSVLGLTWTNVRLKLVKAVGETAVKVMETGFDLVVTLVRDGPAAAWDKLKEHLGDLKQMVIDGIIDMVVDMAVKKAVPKLIAMFIPGAGFLSAILTIYDTVMTFVAQLSRIGRAIGAFIDSIVQIAAGNIGAAAAKVEGVLANLLTLAINLLAGFAGFGKVSTQVMGVIQRVRNPIDKALDAVIGWIVKQGKSLFAKAFGSDQPEAGDSSATRVDKALNAAGTAVARFQGQRVGRLVLRPVLAAIRLRYRLSSLELVPNGELWDLEGTASPKKTQKTKALVDKGSAPSPAGGDAATSALSSPSLDQTVGALGINRDQLSFKTSTITQLTKDYLALIQPKIDAIKNRLGFKHLKHWQVGEPFLKATQLDIRHRVSIKDTIVHTDGTLSKLTVKQALESLKQKHVKHMDPIVIAKKSARPDVVHSARQLLQEANNNLPNLFIGEFSKNRGLGMAYDPGDAAGASSTSQASLDQQQSFVEAFGLEGSTFTVTITRKGRQRLSTQTWKT